MAVIIAKNGESILVDDIDYERANKYKWYVYDKGSKGNSPVTIVKGRQRGFSKMVFDIKQNEAIFHRNGDSLDYRRENIIITNRNLLSHLVGAFNITNKTSKYSGVHYSKQNNKWCVLIKKDISNFCGVFSCEEDAAIVADYFAIAYFGQYAKRNFPEMTDVQINECYNSILNKYGHTKKEKTSKSHQGLGRKIKGQKTSRFVGVAWVKCSKKWAAGIQYLDKNIYIGKFANEEDAAKAYDKKAIELVGENAKRNFPDLSYQELTKHIDNLLKKTGTNKSERIAIIHQGRKSKIGIGSSKFVGVSICNRNKKWLAKIRYNNKTIHIGYFVNEEDAARAYDKKALELYGENAKLNFQE